MDLGLNGVENDFEIQKTMSLDGKIHIRYLTMLNKMVIQITCE